MKLQGQAQNLQEKDDQLIWHHMKGTNKQNESMVIHEADGAWVTDIHGHRYLDGMSGLWCVNVGYGREELAEAAYKQLKTMPYYPLTQSHVPAIQLAEKLNEWLDGDYVIFFSNSGSEANETAFKIAKQYHAQKGESTRTKFISRYRSYHGNTAAALAATGQAQRKFKYEPLGQGFIHVAPPDMYRHPEDQDQLASAAAIDQAMTWELSETIAGVIMEPMITGGGILMPPKGYLKKVKDICEAHGALLIVDEVICGFGRTGKRFGFMHEEVKPDIITMAKGITSGYLPLSATCVKRDIFEAYAGGDTYDRLRHVNTFGGHPASCAVALANIDIMEKEQLVERSHTLGQDMLEQLQSLKEHPFVGDVRGKGLLFGIELVQDQQSKKPVHPSVVSQLVEECKKRGLIIGKNGDTVAGYNNVAQLAPPLSITDEDAEMIIRTLKESIAQL